MKLLNKRVGETTLDLLKRHDLDKPYTYAGRLDPMAEGLVIALTGGEVKNKEAFLKLSKTYDLTVLLGISTDTFDTLGLITHTNFIPVTRAKIESTITAIPRGFDQPYPPYSSKPVDGKPLWRWARENQMKGIKLPTKAVTLHDVILLDFNSIKIRALIPHIISNIAHVDGDFRQKEIIGSWRGLENIPNDIALNTFTVRVHSSSGTYMRSLAVMLGKVLRIPSLALHIKRLKIGDYTIENAVD